MLRVVPGEQHVASSVVDAGRRTQDIGTVCNTILYFDNDFQSLGAVLGLANLSPKSSVSNII